MTIIVYFQASHYRDFKHYCIEYVEGQLRLYCLALVSYSRLVELMSRALGPLWRLSPHLKRALYRHHLGRFGVAGGVPQPTYRPSPSVRRLGDAGQVLDGGYFGFHTAGDHTLFVGKVVEARVRTAQTCLTSHDLPDLYLGGKVLFDQASRRPLGTSPES
jgi:hypothetical protein